MRGLDVKAITFRENLNFSGRNQQPKMKKSFFIKRQKTEWNSFRPAKYEVTEIWDFYYRVECLGHSN